VLLQDANYLLSDGARAQPGGLKLPCIQPDQNGYSNTIISSQLSNFVAF